MATFRQNHQRASKAKSFSLIKIILFVAILAVILVYLGKLLGQINFEALETTKMEQVAVFDFSKESGEDSYFPSNSKGELVEHKHYALSYIEAYEQAEWVAYTLTKESLKKPNVPRAKRFNTDPLVTTKSADYYDYKGSGYSRGHLAPAGDMAFDQEAMQESFFMSNMSPQVIPFNGGIWNELENLVRDWAYKNKSLHVVTGPILTDIDEYIGDSKVGVPKAFYKVLLDIESPKSKAIGFVIPNETSDRPVSEYAQSVDEIEALTGLDFYGLLLGDQQDEVESSFELSDWPFDEKLYRKRVEHWNNRH